MGKYNFKAHGEPPRKRYIHDEEDFNVFIEEAERTGIVCSKTRPDTYPCVLAFDLVLDASRDPAVLHLKVSFIYESDFNRGGD
jgi:hypothetical protein